MATCNILAVFICAPATPRSMRFVSGRARTRTEIYDRSVLQSVCLSLSRSLGRGLLNESAALFRARRFIFIRADRRLCTAPATRTYTEKSDRVTTFVKL
jgi:hypothetical protein